MTATHHSAFTKSVTETSVGHGPTGAVEAYLPVRANVTRGPADSCATPITIVVVTAKKMITTRQSTRALTVTSGMSREIRSGNGASALHGASVPPLVVSFPSCVECRTVIKN